MDNKQHLGFASKKTVIKLCHRCCHVQESESEPERCNHCGKAFLPLNYFAKVHENKGQAFKTLFDEADMLDENHLIKGLYVLW